MPLISFKHKFIYYGPVKTGSTSFVSYYKEYYEGQLIYFPDLDPNPDYFVTHTGRAQHQIVPVDLPEFTNIISVRNPYTRFISMYDFFKPRHNNCSIEEYFKFAFPSITQQLIGIRPGTFKCIEQPSVAHPFPRKNQSKRETKSQLTDTVIDFVRNFYRDDFETFGYSFDPAQEMPR